MNVKKMLDNAMYDFQEEMINEYARQCAEEGRESGEEDFISFCIMYKLETDCSHVETPEFFF